MKAMILAAGLGTRLRPLTDDRPKALVTLAGRTLLEIAICRLRASGVSEVVVNVHHHAEMIVEYLEANNHFGIRVEISREDALLDTGGGLQNASWYFLEDGASTQEPFILHNVDVISTIDLGRMMGCHMERDALATLAVQQRETSRYLLFDQSGQLCGRRTVRTGKDELVRPSEEVVARAFCGIHILSPLIFAAMEERGVFSIIDAYLNLAAKGERIFSFNADEYYWRDLGRPESIAQATLEIASGAYPSGSERTSTGLVE